ncbi:MAG: hypothetical protein PHN82_07690 [bacterium]|nr:hypothetical protein [bacterium]
MALKRVVKKMVGELLIDHGVITKEHLEKALVRKKETGKLLGEILVEMGFAREEDVVDAVATQYHIPYLPLRQHDVDKELLRLIPLDLAVRHRCFPVDRMGRVLTVAMENPLDARAAEEIEALTKCAVIPFVSTHSEITTAINEHYGRLKSDRPSPAPEGEEGIKVFDIEDEGAAER